MPQDDHEPPTAIRKRISELLETSGMSASALAEKAGVERSTVTRILKGERTPTPETLALLAPCSE